MVSHTQVEKLKEPFLDCLPRATRLALDVLCASKILSSNWYLAGGTALALQAGHRQSVDLDFFCTQHGFKIDLLENRLLETGQWKTTLREEGTFFGELSKAKVSFIAYPFFIPARKRIGLGNVWILPKEDIAVMKIIAISQRGRKRDFIDLYWYCKNIEPLMSVLQRAPRQYPGQEHNLPHFLKSLVYFEDAELDPMPKIFFSTTWKTIKQFFEKEVKKITKEVLF